MDDKSHEIFVACMAVLFFVVLLGAVVYRCQHKKHESLARETPRTVWQPDEETGKGRPIQESPMTGHRSLKPTEEV